jgi:hypothetical protein
MDMPPIQYARTEGSVVAPKIAQHLVIVATEGRRRASRRGVVQVGLLPLVERAGGPDDPRSRP